MVCLGESPRALSTYDIGSVVGDVLNGTTVCAREETLVVRIAGKNIAFAAISEATAEVDC